MCKYICVTILYQVTNVVYRGMKMNLKKCNDCQQEISIKKQDKNSSRRTRHQE